MDRGQKETEAILKQIEKRINREYKQAIDEIEDQLSDYLRRFEIKDKKWQEWVESGYKTEDQYKKWRMQQMAVGEKWSEQKEQIAYELAHVNETAKGLARMAAPEIFAENANYSTFKIEKDAKIDTGFTLYSRESVAELIANDPEVLPPVGKKVARDIAMGKAVKWNRQQLQSVMMQGILQGDSIPKLATRLANTVGDRDRKAAIRNARTMATAAQNAGREQSYKNAQAKGIELEQMWIATLDNRTRHSHRWLDGERKPVGEPFSNGCRYPADPEGAPSEIYNCRCTLRAVVKGLERRSGQFRDTSAMDGMTYDEWRNAKATSNPITLPEEKAKAIKQSFINEYRGVGRRIENYDDAPAQNTTKFHSVLMEKSLGTNYNEFRDIVDNSSVKLLYEKYADKINEYVYNDKKVSHLDNAGNRIVWRMKDYDGLNRWTTLAHESGHWFDKCMAQMSGISWNEAEAINKAVSFNASNGYQKIKLYPSSSDEFLSALRKDMENLKASAKDGTLKTAFLADSAMSNRTHGIQDVLNGFYGTKIRWQHDERYWNSDYNYVKNVRKEKELKNAYNALGMNVTNQAQVKRLTRQYAASSEAWAHINSGLTVGGEQLAVYEQYMPNAVEAYKKIIAKVN